MRLFFHHGSNHLSYYYRFRNLYPIHRLIDASGETQVSRCYIKSSCYRPYQISLDSSSQGSPSFKIETISMKAKTLSLLWLADLGAAQSSNSAPRSILTISRTRSPSGGENVPIPTVPSNFQASTFATLTTSVQPGQRSFLSSNATASATSSQEPLTNIGGDRTRSRTGTASGTSPAQPSNTQACNNYPEFCNRKYSNITEVCAHNSPYTRPNNVARNQEYGVTQQLNDGIRMLQGSAHYVNGTLFYCHSSCDLLNAGTVEDYLKEVTEWVATHPFDVVTILFGNSNWADTDANGKPLVCT